MKNLLLSIKKEELIKQGITSFDKDRINEFELEYEECIQLVYEENDKIVDYNFYKDKELNLYYS